MMAWLGVFDRDWWYLVCLGLYCGVEMGVVILGLVILVVVVVIMLLWV